MSTTTARSSDMASELHPAPARRARGLLTGRRSRALRSDVEHLLRGLGSEPVCYWKNPGNAGDSLIHMGALHALERCGVRFERIEVCDDVAGRSVLMGGGGNLVPLYDHTARAFAAFRSGDARRIVMLPHGIRESGDTLRRATPDDVVVCRDAIAAEHVARSGTDARVLLGHDMAFHLDARRLLGDRRLAARVRPLLDDRLATHGWRLGEFGDRAEMCFTRIDSERTDRSPATDIDISHQLIVGETDGDAAASAWCLLSCIDASRRVTTDRLHVAIGAALLRTPVRLLPNSYDKNRSLFDMSLWMFPRVEFVA